MTEKFLPSAPLYGAQFIGDAIKIASWLLAYTLLAKAMKTAYILGEIIFSITYVLFCYWFLDSFGLIGAVYGFLINYLLFWIFMLFLIKRNFKVR